MPGDNVTEQQGRAPEAADTTQTATTGQQGDATEQATAQPTQPTKDAEAQAARSVEDLPEWAQRIVRDARKGEGDYRVKTKELEGKLTETEQREQERADAIAKALGLKEDDSAPDPAELAKQLTAAQEQAQQRDTELRTLRVERAAERAAREHGADVDTLLDSRAFAKKLGDLDPTDTGFSEAVSDLVKTTVDSNPKYKAVQAATSSSADFSSGPGEQRKRTNSLHAAARGHYGVGGD